MDDNRTVVHEHPGLLLAALDGKRVLAASLGDLLLNLVDDRINLAVVGAGSKDKVVAHIGKLCQVEHLHVLAFLVVGGLRGGASDFLGGDTARGQRGGSAVGRGNETLVLHAFKNLLVGHGLVGHGIPLSRQPELAQLGVMVVNRNSRGIKITPGLDHIDQTLRKTGEEQLVE